MKSLGLHCCILSKELRQDINRACLDEVLGMQYFVGEGAAMHSCSLSCTLLSAIEALWLLLAECNFGVSTSSKELEVVCIMGIT